MQSIYVGIDIGTTGVKAVLFNKKGQERYKAHRTYPLHSPTPEIAEQDANEVLEQTFAVLDEARTFCSRERFSIRSVSFSSAMHSLLCVDKKGKPITPLITWADKRSSDVTKHRQENGDAQGFYERTGTPVHPMSPFAKLIWMKENDPKKAVKTAKVIGIKEYVFWHLFNEYVMDESLASATGLMNIHERTWDQEALSRAGITEEQLPRLVPTTEVFYDQNNTPFVIGASDGVLSNLGAGAIESGEVALTIGTSAAIRSASHKPYVDEKGRTFCYLLTDGLWIIGGPVNNGGIVLQWLVEELVKDETVPPDQATEAVMALAEQVPPGANGLMFLPFLTGERAPLWDPNATASYIGLTRAHTREDMIRSALEGTTFNIYSVLLALQELIGIPKKIYASGGFSRSTTWKQIVADVFEQPLHFAKSYESSAFGAVILGMYALGDIDDLAHFKDNDKTEETIMPNQANIPLYRDLTSLYLELSRSIAQHFERLSALQAKQLYT
ncbi:gluconate kinase [Salicibibacter halophilus]|uniref:Gluconate kinase n=1 Tax=Salicibibacter halophilus TaxID=2502791 RepID=A0A514LEY8_9BACI|nr:FGGY family carbohydrate kinase [Salicibibacter halophilus]QDI90410.1 gluconate kinase [Salicibibacter halophilus]